VGADPSSYRLANLPQAFAAYRLGVGSAGRAQAGALAKVTRDAAASTTLSLDDAHWFSTGYGLVAGDTIRIGSRVTATVVGIDVAAGVVTLDAQLTARAGDPVTLDGFTDIGVK
jgi:hypothetical protein